MNNFIEQLSEDIFFIQGKGKGKIPYSNSMIFADHLIDTGISKHHINKIFQKFQVNQIIFSHWHEDHSRDNEMFKNVSKSCHSIEKQVLEDISIFIKYYDIIGKPCHDSFNYYLFDSVKIQNTAIDNTFDNGATLEIGDNLNLEVIHTPGHSAGHCCFYEKNSKIAFFADIDLSAFGPWYGCLDSSLIDFEGSIDKLLNLDVDMVVTGHVGLIKGKNTIKDRLKQYKGIVQKREAMILELFSERNCLQLDGLLRKKIIYKSYRDYYRDYLLLAEQIMLSKHLEKLTKEGVIAKKDDRYYLT